MSGVTLGIDCEEGWVHYDLHPGHSRLELHVGAFDEGIRNNSASAEGHLHELVYLPHLHLPNLKSFWDCGNPVRANSARLRFIL